MHTECGGVLGLPEPLELTLRVSYGTQNTAAWTQHPQFRPSAPSLCPGCVKPLQRALVASVGVLSLPVARCALPHEDSAGAGMGATPLPDGTLLREQARLQKASGQGEDTQGAPGEGTQAGCGCGCVRTHVKK